MPDPSQASRARRGLWWIFGMNGFLMASWATRIPAVKDIAGLSVATLGVVLLAPAVGALVAFDVSGRAAARFGSARVTGWCALAFCVLLPLVGFADHAAWSLAVALVVFGAGNGALDVAMNTHGVAVERSLGRPALAGMHAAFSAGGFLGRGGRCGGCRRGRGRAHPFLRRHGSLCRLCRTRRTLAPHLGTSATAGGVDGPGAPSGPAGHRAHRPGAGSPARCGRLRLHARGRRGRGLECHVPSDEHPHQPRSRRRRVRRILRGDARRAAHRGPPPHGRGAVPAPAAVRVSRGPRPASRDRGGQHCRGHCRSEGLRRRARPGHPHCLRRRGRPSTARTGMPTPRALARVSTLGYLGFLAGPPLVGSLASLTSLRFALVLPVILAAAVVPLARPALRRAADPAPEPETGLDAARAWLP